MILNHIATIGHNRNHIDYVETYVFYVPDVVQAL